jgi:hypothetical protein
LVDEVTIEHLNARISRVFWVRVYEGFLVEQFSRDLELELTLGWRFPILKELEERRQGCLSGTIWAVDEIESLKVREALGPSEVPEHSEVPDPANAFDALGHLGLGWGWLFD